MTRECGVDGVVVFLHICDTIIVRIFLSRAFALMFLRAGP